MRMHAEESMGTRTEGRREGRVEPTERDARMTTGGMCRGRDSGERVRSAEPVSVGEHKCLSERINLRRDMFY